MTKIKKTAIFPSLGQDRQPPGHPTGRKVRAPNPVIELARFYGVKARAVNDRREIAMRTKGHVARKSVNALFGPCPTFSCKPRESATETILISGGNYPERGTKNAESKDPFENKR